MIVFKTISGTSQEELNTRVCSFLEELTERQRKSLLGIVPGETLIGQRNTSGVVPITRSITIFYSSGGME